MVASVSEEDGDGSLSFSACSSWLVNLSLAACVDFSSKFLSTSTLLSTLSLSLSSSAPPNEATNASKALSISSDSLVVFSDLFSLLPNVCSLPLSSFAETISSLAIVLVVGVVFSDGAAVVVVVLAVVC